MTSVINKRQQARNERALQELIRSVPGNDRCADCQTRNPGWASWNLGIFLCMRCGSLHRKMGTHISKVKSLSMDSWTTDQVENMRRKGNDAVNKEYNPKGIKPAIPVDADEADSAMERFIRQKYEHRILEDGKPKPPSRDDSGYHTQRSFDESVSHSSPPIPPKSRKFGFGLRSVSSTSRLPQLSTDRAATPSSPSSAGYGPSSPSVGINKQSRVFGLNLGEANVASVEMKLKMLRDMGFPNDRRNASVLKGHFGDMERAIESLTRLGEGGQNAPSQPAASPSNPDPAPAPISKSAAHDPWSINTTVSSSTGLQVNSSAPAPAAAAPTKSYNPFDAPQPTPQQAPATGLENSFQNLQVSQPLFPHTTGGYPSRQMTAPTALPPLQTSQSYTNSPQPVNHNPFFLSAPQSAQSTGGNPYFHQSAQSTPIQPTQSLSPGNPFFGSVSAQPTGAQQNQAQSPQGFAPPRHANTMPMYSSAQIFAPQQQQPQQQQQYFDPSQTSYNPFNTSNTSPFNIQQQQQQIQTSHNPYQNQQMVMPASRMDKNSILSLYNLAPSGPTTMSTIPEQSQPQQLPPQQLPPQQLPPQQQQTNNPYQTTSPAPSLLTASGSTPQTMQSQSPYNLSTPQRSATMPEFVSPRPGDPTNNNPFFNTAQPQQQQQQQSTYPFPMAAPVVAPAQSAGLGIGLGQTAAAPPPPPTKMNFMPMSHMSKGSVDINGLQNGRHSPDAFASLSARYA